jgi:putative PIN family toxin of toxin-antitoxin system
MGGECPGKGGAWCQNELRLVGGTGSLSRGEITSLPSVDIRLGIIYNTIMRQHRIVIDTNVVVAALRSKRGASYQVLMLLGSEKFSIHLSVPLVLEYEDVARRMLGEIDLTEQDIDDIVDYICAVGEAHYLFFLWRPYLKDAKDDMVLELAITAGCDFIVTYNQRDFQGTEEFGVEVITPQQLLEEIGELK